MVKHPFVVGFLVAELPKMELKREEHDIKQCPLPEESYAFPPCIDTNSWEIQALKDSQLEMSNFTAEQRLNAINISRSLAMAYVMDQVQRFSIISSLLLSFFFFLFYFLGVGDGISNIGLYDTYGSTMGQQVIDSICYVSLIFVFLMNVAVLALAY